jgi:uncharacterized protein YjiS (DUF1127 family)
MMEERMHGEFRLSFVDHVHHEHRHVHHEHRRAARLWRTAWGSSVLAFDHAAQHESLPWAVSDVPVTGREQRRAEPSRSAPLTVTRRIVSAIRLWRMRARSRQHLRELSDHMLKDIGLRREEVGYEFSKPFHYCD